MRPIKDPRRTAYRVNVPGEDDRTAFIGTPITGAVAPVIGATVGPPCTRCGRRVWVAPSSRSVDFKDPRTVVVCVSCAALDPKIGPVLARVALDVALAGRVPEEE